MHELARVSNGVGDVLLGVVHLIFCFKSRRGRLVPLYFLSLASFQLLGASYHFCDPAPSQLDLWWFAYLVCGATAPCLYGMILSLDCGKPSWPWIAGAAAYFCLVAARFDLGLASSFEITFSPAIAKKLEKMPWMESALRLNNQQFAGQRDLVLRFDGRGYAATPFDKVFDDEYKDAFDLVAPFPCWQTHSLSFLMLCVGVLCNFFQFVLCRLGGRSTLGNVLLTAALLTMPAAMLFGGGVPAGIDWMHAWAAPTLLLQARTCFDILDGDVARREDDEDGKRVAAAAAVRPKSHPSSSLRQRRGVEKAQSRLTDDELYECDLKNKRR